MDRSIQTAEDYTQPRVPPATPPVIDAAADADDAATRAGAVGDSDYEGRNRSSFDRSAEDEEIAPGEGGDDITPDRSPNEVEPDDGDIIEPSGPSEIEIEREDVDQPGQTPSEVPAQTLLPPD